MWWSIIQMNIDFLFYEIGACDGIGRHARFRFSCGNACGFESLQAHQDKLTGYTKGVACQLFMLNMLNLLRRSDFTAVRLSIKWFSQRKPHQKCFKCSYSAKWRILAFNVLISNPHWRNFTYFPIIYNVFCGRFLEFISKTATFLLCSTVENGHFPVKMIK